MTPSLRLLPWQAEAWSRIARSIADDRLGHALLLAGPAGTGKREFARLIAAALWCRTTRAEGLPCGVCDDCRQVLTEVHSGYSLLRTEEGKRDIPIDAVRQLGERSTLTSSDGRAKVAIIDPADALNLSGVNALLKTIEEPTPHSHLLLISERPLALVPTLRSRCQTLRFAVPAAPVALQWLAAELPETDATVLAAALTAARGAPLRALDLIETGLIEAHAEWQALLASLAEGRVEPLQAAAAIGEGRAAAFIDWLYGALALLLQDQITPASRANPLAAVIRDASPARLEAYLAEVQDGARRLAGNVRALLVLESLTIGWTALLARTARA
jgi:DNA polymerase-3 subunit delta'